MTLDHILKAKKPESAALMAYKVGDGKTTLWCMCDARCEWGCSHLMQTAPLGEIRITTVGRNVQYMYPLTPLSRNRVEKKKGVVGSPHPVALLSYETEEY